MVLRWFAAAYLETEKHFRRIMGYEHLWALKAKLQELRKLRLERLLKHIDRFCGQPIDTDGSVDYDVFSKRVTGKLSTFSGTYSEKHQKLFFVGQRHHAE